MEKVAQPPPSALAVVSGQLTNMLPIFGSGMGVRGVCGPNTLQVDFCVLLYNMKAAL